MDVKQKNEGLLWGNYRLQRICTNTWRCGRTVKANEAMTIAEKRSTSYLSVGKQAHRTRDPFTSLSLVTLLYLSFLVSDSSSSPTIFLVTGDAATVASGRTGLTNPDLSPLVLISESKKHKLVNTLLHIFHLNGRSQE